MEYDLILKNGQLIDPCNFVNGKYDIGICDGKIISIEKEITTRHSMECLDCSGKIIMPGIIDPHVHISKWLGGGVGHKMMATRGVITALDLGGPGEEIITNLLEMGAGLNIGWLNAINFSLESQTEAPSSSKISSALNHMIEEGALGVKILGGHYPLEPDATAEIIAQAERMKIYCAFHAGTTETGSDLKGFLEAVQLANKNPLHIPHINSYCRGRYDSPVAESQQALETLNQSGNIFSESYLSQATGTSGLCKLEVPVSNVTKRCLEMGGYVATEQDLARSMNDGYTSVSVFNGGENILVTGESALKYWREMGTDVTVSFPANVLLSIFSLATAKNAAGKFIVDALSTDGGGIPRNSIVSHGLSLVRFGALTLQDFILKSSAAPAAMLGLKEKGHLGIGADADITVLDLEKGKATLGVALGRIIMVDGIVVGRNGTLLTTRAAEPKLSQRGIRCQTVEISSSLGRGPHPLYDLYKKIANGTA